MLPPDFIRLLFWNVPQTGTFLRRLAPGVFVFAKGRFQILPELLDAEQFIPRRLHGGVVGVVYLFQLRERLLPFRIRELAAVIELLVQYPSALVEPAKLGCVLLLIFLLRPLEPDLILFSN